MSFEQFIYIGFVKHTLFFIHTIHDTKQYDQSVSHQVFNVLINNKMITNINHNVIIFEMNTMNVIVIQHANKTPQCVFGKDKLNIVFDRLCLAKRNDIITVVRYHYDNKGYDIVTTKHDALKNITKLTSVFKTNEIINVITKKPIS